MTNETLITSKGKDGKEFITIHAWRNGGAITCFQILERREKSMRVRNLDNNMEVTVPYSGLKSMGDKYKEYKDTDNYYPAEWWMASKDTSEYVRRALCRA